MLLAREGVRFPCVPRDSRPYLGQPECLSLLRVAVVISGKGKKSEGQGQTEGGERVTNEAKRREKN